MSYPSTVEYFNKIIGNFSFGRLVFLLSLCINCVEAIEYLKSKLKRLLSAELMYQKNYVKTNISKSKKEIFKFAKR
jgi:hypothetical protein